MMTPSANILPPAALWKLLRLIVPAFFLLAGSAIAADQGSLAATAENKAAVLEQLAAKKEQDSAPPTVTRAEVQAVDPAGQEPLDDAITCLARTIYWEARGEDADGMEAIADVVMNRLGHAGFPATVCGVVKQGKEKKDCQFSWWCDGRPDDAQEEGRYAVAKEIARKALNRQLVDKTSGALYFHQRHVTPEWAKKYVRTAEVGEHLFYKPRNDAAK